MSVASTTDYLLNPTSYDELDRRIIVALEEDGRRSYREIARELAVSEGTIRQRVSRLTNSGIIRITAVGNFLALGVGVVAMVMVRVKPGHVEETAAILAGFPNVRFVSITLGSSDIIFQALHSSPLSMHKFVSEELPRAASAIVGTETFQLIKTIKSSWHWSAWFNLADSAE